MIRCARGCSWAIPTGISAGPAQFPFPDITERILKTYYIITGGKLHATLQTAAAPAIQLTPDVMEIDRRAATSRHLTWPKEGHDGLVGVNYTWKVQIPTAPSIFGAMPGRRGLCVSWAPASTRSSPACSTAWPRVNPCG